jgi:GntR family transcriptional regulator
MGSMETSFERFPRRRLIRKNGPLYQQLVEQIRHLIASGQFEVGSELPKEAEIGERLGVSLITVRRALRELEDLGIVRKRSAKPAMVTAKFPIVQRGQPFHSYRDIVEINRNGRLVVRSFGKETGALVEQFFGLDEGEPGYCLRACVFVDHQPRTLVTSYLPPDLGSQMAAEDFTDSIIFRNLQRRTGVHIDRALVTARAEVASKAAAAELGIKPGGPMMTTEMVFLSDDEKVVEVTHASTSSENFMLSYEIQLESLEQE